MTTLLLFLFLALGVSFLCSVLEAVLLSTTRYFIEAQDTRLPGVLTLRRVKEEIDLSIGAILTLNTIAHTVGAAGVGAEATELFGHQWAFAVSAVLTLLILYLSEIIPKTIGALYWRRLAIPAAFLIRGMVIITYPFLVISGYLTQLLRPEKQAKISRDEILAVAAIGEEDGVIGQKEGDLLESLILSRKYRVSDILTPRVSVVALPLEMTLQEAASHSALESYSRIPVYRGDMDHIEGVVYSRQVLANAASGKGALPLEALMEPVFVISENLPVLTVMDQFLKRREHLFLVRDRYGQMVGIVTLEDVLETILGMEIMDEFDTVEETPLAVAGVSGTGAQPKTT